MKETRKEIDELMSNFTTEELRDVTADMARLLARARMEDRLLEATGDEAKKIAVHLAGHLARSRAVARPMTDVAKRELAAAFLRMRRRAVGLGLGEDRFGSKVRP